MHRKIALIVAAVLVPGGLIALVCSYLFRSLARTERGKKMFDAARAALRTPVFAARQAA